MINDIKNSPCCSFCGKSEVEVKRLIAGADVFICNECVDVCSDIMKQEAKLVDTTEIISLKPISIKEHMDAYIIAQNHTKRVLSVAVYNHYKRLSSANKNDDSVEISKSNVLLIGPTGCGKTLFASTLAKLLKVPFAIADATTLTEAGYVGEDVENILLRLLQSADYDVEAAKKGIIYIDEIDKIAKKSENISVTRDVSGEGVQQSLLKIIEGTVASIPPQGGRKHPQQDCIRMDTSDILYIFGGAFVGLENIIKSRIKGTAIGFASQAKSKIAIEDKILRYVQPEDLIKFGLIPEFIGRLPIIATLDDLTEEDLIKILTEPKNALTKQYEKMLMMDGVKLIFTDESLKKIARLSLQHKTGARGLRSILENILLDHMFDIPSNPVEELTITEDMVIDYLEEDAVV